MDKEIREWCEWCTTEVNIGQGMCASCKSGKPKPKPITSPNVPSIFLESSKKKDNTKQKNKNGKR